MVTLYALRGIRGKALGTCIPAELVVWHTMFTSATSAFESHHPACLAAPPNVHQIYPRGYLVSKYLLLAEATEAIKLSLRRSPIRLLSRARDLNPTIGGVLLSRKSLLKSHILLPHKRQLLPQRIDEFIIGLGFLN